MATKEQLRKATMLKVILRSEGVDIGCDIEGIGTKYKEDFQGLFQTCGAASGKIHPPEMILAGKITTKLIYNKDSPYIIKKEGKDYFVHLKGKEEPLLQIHFPPRPKFYGMKTSDGTEMRVVAQVMGTDCMAIAVARNCYHWRIGKPCKFCNIDPTTVRTNYPVLPDLGKIEEVVKATKGQFPYFDLTGGTFEDRDQEAREYAKIGNIINGVVKKKYGGPFSFTPPNDLSLLKEVYKTNVDVISFNIEVWDEKKWQEVCPGKAQIGRGHFLKAFNYAKGLWGDGNVVVQLVAGPWESSDSLLNGSKEMLARGILPNIAIYYPLPNSVFQNMKPLTTNQLISFYLEMGELYKEYDSIITRNSILVSESGARSTICNEVYKGFLTKDSFDKNELAELSGNETERVAAKSLAK